MPDAGRFEPLLKKLTKELQDKELRYYEIDLKQFETWPEIKKLGDEDKIDLLFYLIKAIFALKKKVKLSYDSGNPAFILKELYSVIFKALMKSKIKFSGKQVIALFEAYREGEKNSTYPYSFANWPLGLTAKQLEYVIQRKGVSTDFKRKIIKLLEWPEFDETKNYWGSDPSKVKIKIQQMVLQELTGGKIILPYELSEEDEFGVAVNQYIEELSQDKKDFWYGLFHHGAKANGSKPSAKFLKTAGELIDQIGVENFQNKITEWIDFLCAMKAKETVHHYDNYDYTSYFFLDEKNSVLIKGMLWCLGAKKVEGAITGELARLIERAFQKIPGVGPTAAAVGNAAIYLLSNAEGLEGVSHLSRLKLKISQNNTKKLIEKGIEEASEKLNVTPEEIEEMAVMDFGLKNGQKESAFKDYTLKLAVEENGKVSLRWFTPEGKEQKSPPSFIKNSEELSTKLKEIKNEAKAIQKNFSAQKDRIDRSFILDRKIAYESFKKYYLNHGLVGVIAQKLIWTFQQGDKTEDAIFVNGKWLNLHGKKADAVCTAKGNTGKNPITVRLWHPIHAETGVVLTWRNHLEKLGIKQPIKQAWREIYLLTDAELKTKTYSNRMAAHILKQHQFNALRAIRGWRYSLLGAYDDGKDGEIATLPLKSYSLRAEFWINEINIDDAFNDSGIWDYISTDQLRFVKENDGVMELTDVPEIVFSETMRDADLFAGVASVGNDPNWMDSGGTAAHRSYWESYSFGDLTEIAKVRKSVLENLLPRLKIRETAKIDGKFLIVKGKIRTYKIHIGSSNILMEPNDEYLCIVSERKQDKNTEKIFLPFEGDRGLSLVLSKAFLLAEDDKITDSTILSQIKR